MPSLRTLMLGTCLAAAFACESGRDQLLAQLQSARPEERAVAVRKLAESAHADDLGLFTQAAKDPSALVRGEALAALAKSQDPRVVDLIGDALTDDDEGVQAMAARALAEVKGEKAKAYLTVQFSRRGRGTRHAIVEALKAAQVPKAMESVVATEAKAIWERNLQSLQDGSLAERVGAAEALGKSGRPQAVERLGPLTKDSQIILAAAAVRGLGDAGDRRAVPLISSLLSENYPELREAACGALLKLADPSALPQLLAVALERSSVSAVAVSAIVALPPSDEASKALCKVALEAAPSEALAAGREMRKRGGCSMEPVFERLRSSSTQPGALVALAGLGPSAKEAAPKVAPLLAYADPSLLRLAVEALAELGDPVALPALEKLYQKELKSLEPARADWVPAPLSKSFAPGFDPSAPSSGTIDEQRRAKQALLVQKVAELDQARAKAAGKHLTRLRPPKELVSDVEEEQLKLLAALLRAFGRLGAQGAVELLSAYVPEDSTVLRAAAYAGLAALAGKGVELAKEGLTDPDREVQKSTAQALAEMGAEGRRALIEILPGLGDKSRALEALSRFELEPSAIPALEGVVREDGAEAALAAQLLGHMGAKDSAPVLVAYLKDPTGVARREVLLALGRLGAASAAEIVGKDLFDDSPDIRAAAAEALAALGPGQHRDALEALQGDYYRRVREAAKRALESGAK